MSIALTLLFTRGVSLRLWEERGMLGREVALYRRLGEKGVRVAFVTHGDRRDLALAGALGGIRVVCNRHGLPGRLWRGLAPVLGAGAFRAADVVKTNQTLGAEMALRAARLWRRPLIARCGFMLSKNEALEHGPESPQARRALATEARVFQAAARVVVTTEEMRASVLGRFPALERRTVVIPNYVDTDLFCPGPEPGAGPPRLVFVGRLAREKNVAALIEAVRGLDVDLDLIGDGPERAALAAQARDLPRVRLLGALPHAELPARLRAATALVLPSLYEGHPKVALEAMACGLPVIASDVPGIRAVVRSGETGLLCGTDAAALRGAIRALLGDAALRGRLGRQARAFAVAHWSLDTVAERELNLLHEVVEEWRRR